MTVISRPRAAAVPRANLPAAFVFDEWYVGAWAQEITRVPMRRVVLDEPIVFYRKQDGAATALLDRCVHRAYPLSAGTLDGDNIVCGYHGFVYDACGTCVAVPGQASVPRSAAVRAFPLIERGPFVWIWMGDPDRADPASVPNLPWIHDAAWHHVKDFATIKARYALLVDNLMDLSHETYIHGATIGSADIVETPITTATDGNIVRVGRHMSEAEIPANFKRYTGLNDGTIDRWQDIEYHVPACYTLHIRVAPHGAGDEAAFFTKIVYALTPETKNSTHLIRLISKSFGFDQPDWVAHTISRAHTQVLEEDRVALELLEQNLPTNGHWQELSVNFDRGGLQWRRVFRQRLGQQSEANETVE
ncbi:MAG TPA: aromatic ring-hydroxylating dioxygenase subunit alpha [Candidatus Lustribacter sp.]